MGLVRVSAATFTARAPWALALVCVGCVASDPGTPTTCEGASCPSDACGAAPWGSRAGAIHVLAGEDGDGSEERPFGTLREGLDAVAARGGGEVVVGEGWYAETLRLDDRHDGVSILGRCPDLVVVDGGGAEVATVTLAGSLLLPRVTLAGFTITGGLPGLDVSGVDLTGEDLVVDGNRLVGVRVGAGARLDLERVTVSGTRPLAGALGHGIDVGNGGVVVARELTLDGNTDMGIYVGGTESSATLTDSVITGTLVAGDGTGGRGIQVHAGGWVDGERIVVAGNRRQGIYADGVGSRLTLRDAEVRDTEASADGLQGQGAAIEAGATLSAQGTSFVGNTNGGMAASGAGSRIELTDCTVTDTRPSWDEQDGRGLNVADGAAVVAERLLVGGNRSVGIYAGGAGTSVDLVDSEVSGTRGRPDAQLGYGIAVQFGATLAASDLRVLDNRGEGIGVQASDASLRLEDSEVAGTRLNAQTAPVVAVSAQSAVAELIGVRLHDNEGIGLFAGSEAWVSLVGSTVERNQYAGLLATAGSLQVEDSVITETGPSVELGGGLGVYVTDEYGPADVALTRTTIGPHPYAAVWIDGASFVDVLDSDLSASGGFLLGGTLVHGNAVFAERTVPAFDVPSRLAVRGTRLHGATDAAVLLHDATAELADDVWEDNGVDLVQQHCDRTGEMDAAALGGAATWEICPARDRLVDFALDFHHLDYTDLQAEVE